MTPLTDAELKALEVETKRSGVQVFPAQTIPRLLATIREVQLELAARKATIAMTVSRLGGVVEGSPTGRHNLLQRVDELVRIEAEHRELQRENRVQRRALEIMDRTAHDYLRTRNLRPKDFLSQAQRELEAEG